MSDASLNPYQPPAALNALNQLPPEEPIQSAEELPDELIGSAHSYRLFAAILDNAAATILFFVAAMSLATDAPVQWLPAVAGISSYLGYYFFTEWLSAATPGKHLMGLCVCQLSGERCSARQISIRTLLRIVEVNPGGCGAIPAGIAVYCTSRRQRLGDWLAGTLVVRKSRLRQFRRP
jgi:uncharacterized RDD family membrane protein YckC